MKKIIILVLCICTFFSCSEKRGEHFITDKKYRSLVHEQFLKAKELAENRSKELFSIFDQNLTTEQTEALEFLYAYMPLSDLADYTGEFFLEQVNVALEARKTFSWGAVVPEDIFRHFVLVHRVNNENLDTARTVFFKELKERVKNLSMHDAALEVNHWCHEKVNYQPSDGRTSAPLATLQTSWGRCGEESTFTVTAMRAVGIPARQCYTPRWAHTDDNHAWVEVWIDGKWHYLGACEPEPELDMAWFTAPAKRAMMVHTNVFGNYTGPETVNFKNELYTKINILPNYTQTKTIHVKVLDKNGKAIENAIVKYKLYNYAEFYTLADQLTNKDGLSSLVTGLGDLLIWVNKNNEYGYQKIDVRETDTLLITLDHAAGKEYEELMTIVPPAEQKVDAPSGEEQAKNMQRLAYEDSIRNTYKATFVTQQQAYDLAKNLDLDKENVWKYLQLSQGNHQQIQLFFEKYAKEKHLFPFLASLSDKDLRDVRFATLDDHFMHATALLDTNIIHIDEEILVKYVYSPRIHLELIRPWRALLQSKFDKHFIRQVQYNPQVAANWIHKNIQLNTERNYYKCPLSPMGVYDLKVTDMGSRNILFVAICRSFGIPARIEWETEKPQYLSDGNWKDAVFENVSISQKSEATLILKNDPANHVKPEYWKHFTLAYFKEGDFVSLDYENSPLLQNFPAKLLLDAGYYKLATGNRNESGTVSTKTIYFELKKSENKELTISLIPVKTASETLGHLDLNEKVKLSNGTQKTFSQLQNNKGIIIAVIDPQKEPTRHVMNDIPSVKKDFEKWGGGILFLIPDTKITKDFNISAYKNLPTQSVFAIDEDEAILKKIVNSMKKFTFKRNLPLIIFVTSKGEIVFSSEGYRIGINEDLIKIINSVD